MPHETLPPTQKLASLLREIRLRSGKKQLYVAALAGCTQPNISQIEHARQHPTREILSAYIQLTREEPTMRRRLILTAAAAGITGPLFSEQALAETVDRAVRPDVDAWDAKIATLGEENMRFGSQIMRPKIGAALAELMDTPHTGKLGPHQAKLIMLYARTEPGPRGAEQGYSDATAAAEDTGDANTIAWVNGRAALAAGGHEETAHQTAAFANRAIAAGADTRSRHPLGAIGVYLAYAALARGWANLGNWENTVAYTYEAMRAYEAVDPDEDGSEYTYSAWRHALTMSYQLSLIGHNDAECWSEQAWKLGAQGRFATHLQLHQAIRLHRSGDPEGASLARQAMAETEGDATTLILRTMAVQAGATEFSTAA